MPAGAHGPASDAAAPTHRIGVRVVDGKGEFYDRRTGRRRVPRGANYLRRGWQDVPYSGRVFHSTTFAVGRYDARRAERALADMHALGYDAVRVFVDGICARRCVADPRTRTISRAYVANLTDFLRRAKRHRVYVLLTADAMPPVSRWHDLLDAYCCTTFGRFNLWYLTPAGIESFASYWQALIRELLRQRAPTDAIWAYSLANESHYDADYPPLTLLAGAVTTANGRTYDLSLAAERQRMLDENLVHWIDSLRHAIRAVDPTALVTIGFFPPRPGDTHVVRARAAFASTADFVDLHAYPTRELTLAQLLDELELPRDQRKPVVMGELGAFKFAYTSPEAAARALVAWQVVSCRHGFDGWLAWTWDTAAGPPGEPALWTAQSADGRIARALSPRRRPNPCSAATTSRT